MGKGTQAYKTISTILPGTEVNHDPQYRVIQFSILQFAFSILQCYYIFMNQHRLSSIDKENMNATCLVCGPNTPIVKRGGTKYKDKDAVMCLTKKRNEARVRRSKNPNPNWHTISNRNLESRKGDCKICGPDIDLSTRGVCLIKNRQRSKDGRLTRRSKDGWQYSLADKQAILLKQDNKCDICSDYLTMNTAMMDHCHSKISGRGILCRTCNLMLGYAKDNEQIMLAGINYLRKWNAQETSEVKD